MHRCVKQLCKKKDDTGKPLLDRCKEACDTSCDDMPRCEGWYSWDPSFNNSCFGASNADAAKAKRNGVCEDGGPGAVHQYCAFGTDSDDCSESKEKNYDGEEVPRVHPSCTGPLADLIVDRGRLEATVNIETIAAPEDACFVEEGCLSGTGSRKVLRFATRVHNIGCAPFVIGRPDGWCGFQCNPDCARPDTVQVCLGDCARKCAAVAARDGRRLGTDSPSDEQQPPPSLDGSSPSGESMWEGGFNTSNSFKNGNGHYSGSTKARDGGTTTGRYPSRRRLEKGWSWHDCHQHWHYENYAHYALRSLCTDDTVAWEDRAVVGHKAGWCVADTDTYGGGTGNYYDERVGGEDRCSYYNWITSGIGDPERGLHGFGCSKMGISSGCSDEYGASFDCQWIDITDTPDGYYWLTVATNWDEAGREETSPENDYTNNEASLAIHIQDHTVTVLSSAQVHQQCPNGSAGAQG